ncbi:cytochrome P450 3A31-like [Oppia nitens]|uniref:cytochrome P450 3A31-like n=1 Tax=Oppia nitens TaxID=1686743 RepID=UPI0023DA4984|nr:cytochrome P450 3A31-like [Oppia nitens]
MATDGQKFQRQREWPLVINLTDYQKYLYVNSKHSMSVLSHLFRPENMKNIESLTETVFRKFATDLAENNSNNKFGNSFLQRNGWSLDRLDARLVIQEMVMQFHIDISFGQSFTDLNLSADKFTQSMPRFDKNRRLLLTTMLVPSLVDPVIRFYGKLFGETQRYFIDSTHKLIEHRRQLSTTTTTTTTTSRSSTTGALEKPNDFLQLFVDYRHKSGDGLTDNEIVSLYYACYLASYEPMCLMLSMAVYELARQPSVQQRLYDELSTLRTGSRGCGSGSNGADIQELPYLNAVLLETIRMYPSFVANRRAQEDVYLADIGVTVPKGTDVEMSFISMYYNPQYFPDPYRFNPDRFMRPLVDQQTANTFLPFGSGKYTYCIGQRFAKLVLKLGLAKLVERFMFEPTATTEIPFKFNRFPDILLPKSYDLKFVLRK